MFPTNRIERIFNIKGQDRVQIVTRIGVLMQVSLRQGRYRMEHVSSTIQMFPAKFFFIIKFIILGQGPARTQTHCARHTKPKEASPGV